MYKEMMLDSLPELNENSGFVNGVGINTYGSAVTGEISVGTMEVDNAYTIDSVYTPTTRDTLNIKDLTEQMETMATLQREMLKGNAVDEELQAVQRAGKKQISGFKIC